MSLETSTTSDIYKVCIPLSHRSYQVRSLFIIAHSLSYSLVSLFASPFCPNSYIYAFIYNNWCASDWNILLFSYRFYIIFITPPQYRRSVIFSLKFVCGSVSEPNSSQTDALILINPISKWFTLNRRFTADELPTWVEQSNKAWGSEATENASAKPEGAKHPSSPAGLARWGSKWLARLVPNKDCIFGGYY